MFTTRFLVAIVIVLIGFANCARIFPTYSSDLLLDNERLNELMKDNHGCDAVVNSCGNKGLCCDIHDACYKTHGCTAASWVLLWGNCATCNKNVMSCVAFRNPGKSTCCSQGNCGKPRP
ncbi:unnamed protein product [Rotaria socialis]|uniref:Uncharacterized protein n=1 Tax=Rotaria socialis TaxID=392032 RepID=A0A818LKQ6_9BILA|nr:unnamed protein product [Rotaria socialis]